MSLDEQKIINEAVAKLERLNGEDFQGYRSEVWNVVAEVVKRASEELNHVDAFSAPPVRQLKDLNKLEFIKYATEFLKFLAQDHDHKFNTDREALTHWANEKFPKLNVYILEGIQVNLDSVVAANEKDALQLFLVKYPGCRNNKKHPIAITKV